MSVKAFIYIITTPFMIWIISSLNLDRFFQKNKRSQIIALYVSLALGLSYLVVNFIYDFYEVTRIIQ